jgi:eukaryotic-like serine/threonine-protein kinase
MSERTAPGLEWPGQEEWTVPGYAEERPLGRGVSGRVVAAVNTTTGQRVAIKYFAENLLLRDPEFLREFRSDAEQLMSLDSAHVARIFEFVEQPGRGSADSAHAARVFDFLDEPGQGVAVVMALVEGVSLREMITRRGPLGAEAALVVLKDSLLGLAAAHSLPVTHRDLKPDNVLIDAKGWCTLTDFDIAVKASKRIPARGTPPYMAPELWDGASSAPTSDIYAATVTLWESLTGKPPFSGGLRRVRRQHKSAAVPLDEVNQALRGLITSGMAKDPADRPQSARSVVHDLEAAAADTYGPDWEDHGRSELAERAAALLPLLAAGKGGKSATATRRARRRLLSFALVGTGTTVALVVLAAAALSAMSGSGGKAQLTSLSAAASAAQVIVTPPVAASRCATATAFTFSGTVTATQPGTLSYRWLYSSGKQGPVETLSFTAPGHEQVSGETVEAAKAGTGWAEIKVLSAIPKTSNKATYQLLCTTANSGLALSASVQPKAQTVSSCADAPPILTADGSIKAKKAESVRYYWALADGQHSATRTVTFKRAGTRTLAPLDITPPALPASGEVVLVVTKPVAAASKPAKYTVSCIAPISTVPNPPVQGTSPSSSRSSAGSPPNPGHTTAAPTSKATTAAPTTPATSATSPASTPASTASTSPATPPSTPPSTPPATPPSTPSTPTPIAT